MNINHFLSISLAAVCVFNSSLAAAASKPQPKIKVEKRQHEDIFGENEIRLGLKAGPQVNGYTSIQGSSGAVSAQSSARWVAGVALEFVYGLPIIEVDFFWNARGGFNNGQTLNAASFPGLIKFPLRFEDGLELQVGAGVQADYFFSGPQPRRTWMFGALGALGLSIDLDPSTLFNFEFRYDHGLNNLSESLNGAKPRDFQVIAGVLWRF